MNVKGWTAVAVLVFVLGLSACQRGAEEATEESGAQPMQEPMQQPMQEPTQEYGGEQ